MLALLLIVVIFGIKILDTLLKTFNLNIFQYSFGDGNLNYTIEVNSKEDIQEELIKKNIVYFYFDKEKNFFLTDWYLKIKKN